MTKGTGSTECIKCPAGNYEVDRKTCLGCPMGTFSIDGVASASECTPCPPGTMTKSTGRSECERCSPGQYEVDRRNCVKCPQGTYTPVGVASISECMKCPEGFYTSDTGNKECYKCKPGNYAFEGKTCLGCPQGTYSAVGVASVSECTPCPAGFMTGNTGNTECKRCSSGFYEVERKYCEGCPMGTYSNEGVASASECKTCPPGTITRKIGTTECERCPWGTYESERTKCIHCPAGTFAPTGVAGIEECIPCPAGSIAHGTGSTQCAKCPEGQYESKRIECLNCPSGMTSPAGSKSVSECKPKN